MSTTTLLPRNPCMDEHPPIYLKLNEAAIEILASALRENSSVLPNVSLSISDRAASLRINDYEFQGSHYREPGSVQVFAPENTGDTNSVFRSMGFVQNRVSLKQDKPLKISSDSSEESMTSSSGSNGDSSTASLSTVRKKVDLTRPTESKIIGLLAIKPHTASELISKTQASSLLVRAVLDEAAIPIKADSLYFRLKPDVQDAIGLPGSRQSTTDGKSHKRKISTDTTTTTTNKRTKNNEDMFELARKFREVYGEYLELYSKLSNPKSRPPSQVQRLMAMHKQLGQWKKTLWSNARSKQVK